MAEEERAAGQTVRGKGSIGPGCLGEVDPLLQKSPHQASSYRPGPLRGVLPVCTEVICMDKREENSLVLAERLGSGYGTSYGVFDKAERGRGISHRV